MRKRRRVAIVYPFTNLDSVPSLYNTVVLLAEHGYLVDVFTHFDDVHLRPRFESARVSVLPAYIPSRSERPLAWRYLPGRVYWLLNLLSRHRQARYVCVIGVDPQGLARAQMITRWVHAPLAYYSLELLLSYELVTEDDRQVKAQERSLSSQAVFVIIQDEERAALLRKDNDLAPDRIFCVPNAPLGPASRRRSDYLRHKLNLSPEVKIVLHTGSLGAWTGIHHLMRSTHEWPDTWVLVCHTRYKASSLVPDYLEALRYIAKPGSVIFSTDPISRQEYPALVESANVGVVFYCVQPGSTYTQDNINHIGLSSGKLAYFLWAGVPVVVNHIPTLRRLVDTYRCGVVTDDPAQTCEAIARILADYDTYSRNATVCFDRELDFATKFERVLDALDRL